MKPNALLLLLAALTAGSIGVISARRAGDPLEVIRACNAVNAGRWQKALELTEGHTGSDDMGRAAAECRCRALLAVGRGDECENLLERILSSREASDWAPSPDLAVHLIQGRRQHGRSAEAAALARRAARAWPSSHELFYLELLTRSAVEDEAEVLRELAERPLPRGPSAVRMLVSLANRHLLRGDPDAALAALGELPPRGAGDELGVWFETRGMAQASAGDLAGLRDTYSRWSDVGGDEAELRARYALTLSIGKLEDPEQPTLELLRTSLSPEPRDPRLAEALTIRLVLGLVSAGRFEEALAAYDHGRQRFVLEGLTREELLRADEHARLAQLPVEERRGRLLFRVSRAQPGSTLHVSPDLDAPVDAPYEVHALPDDGVVAIERSVGEAPLRWVLRDAAGATRASGTAAPRAMRETELAIRPGRAMPPAHFAATRRPGDGRRRIAWILLDCADWRISRYLLTRGELPVQASLIERGHRAVLWSDPPLTAAALEALVWPERSRDVSFVGLVHRFGVELAGLSSVGDNPFSGLRWVLPDARDLFATLGAGEASAANLLFAHGGVHAGRHGVVSGPHGAQRSVALGTSARDLRPEEQARFPELAAVRRERDAIHLRTIAAELDATLALVRAGEPDLVALRVEPLDILTHAHFAGAVRDGQDDGRGLLFSVYRYLDARIGEIDAALDEDDVLVVMSDHGIRTAMEHAPEAIFLAAGAGIPAGRAPGRPALRGVSRTLADWLGVATDWPDTGVAPGLTALATKRIPHQAASATR